MKRKIEILAPAGNKAMVDSAILAGADAIYLGGKNFTARAFSDNFSDEELKDIIQKCHLKNVKVYLTLNTIFKDEELLSVLIFAVKAFSFDVDAFIVQDFSLAKLLKKVLPDASIHGSTQMGIYNYSGAVMAYGIGLDRIILARETELVQIQKIKRFLNIELEAFVHGSLCVCFSGNCLMSSMIGGRSGNRGRCAQPCRKDYILSKTDNSSLTALGGSPKYFLNTNDLCLINNFEELIDAGISSFKIEGRMKKPEYVYFSVKNYREALEGKSRDEEELALVSNRKFTKGLSFGDFGRRFIDAQRIGGGVVVGQVVRSNPSLEIRFDKSVQVGDVISFQDTSLIKHEYTLTQNLSKDEVYSFKASYKVNVQEPVFKVFSATVQARYKDGLHCSNKKFPIDFEIICKIGHPIRLNIILGDVSAEVVSDFIAESSINRPITRDNVFGQLKKLGDTVYYLRDIDINLEDNCFVPLKVFNDMRNMAVEKIDFLRLNVYRNAAIELSDDDLKELLEQQLSQERRSLKKKISYALEFNELPDGIENYNEYPRLYLHRLEDCDSLKDYCGEIFYVLPRIIKLEQEKGLLEIIDKYIEQIDGFEVNNIGDLVFLKKFASKKLHFGFGLNIFNSLNISEMSSFENCSVTLSPELNLHQIDKLRIPDTVISEVLGYGKVPVMIMEHCPASELKNCGDDRNCRECSYQKGYTLLDQKKAAFQFNRFDNYTEIYNNIPTHVINFIDRISSSKNIDQLRLKFVNESTLDIQTILNQYKLYEEEGTTFKIVYGNSYTKGHYFRGIE